MSAFEIMEDLFFIERGYLNGNHLVYRSGEPILIDTAFSYNFDETSRCISELGVELSDIHLIINTHCHCDHVGGNKIIQEESDCDIALHRIGKHFIDIRDDWSTLWRYYDHEAEFFACTMSLEDGDMLSIGPHEFRVIHTPGHSPDGIVFYNAKEKALISGDTLWENDFPVPSIRVEGVSSLFAMQESFEKLEDLEVKTVYPGHGKPFTNLREAISISKKKNKACMMNREMIGMDVLKKVTVFNLMLKKAVGKDEFFEYLIDTHWFKETIDFYFDGEYEAKYNDIISGFLKLGVIEERDGKLIANINP